MLLNSSRSSASPLDINVDKWKSLTLSGISVYLDKSLRISRSCALSEEEREMEISIGVTLTSSQTAVGSTLREKLYQLVKWKLKIPPKFKQISNKVYFAKIHCILENRPPCSLLRLFGAHLVKQNPVNILFYILEIPPSSLAESWVFCKTLHLSHTPRPHLCLKAPPTGRVSHHRAFPWIFQE